MSTFLFEQIIFGPVKSRRLGISLGINLLPTNRKHCTFNCIYCECGWTQTHEAEEGFPQAHEIKFALENKLVALHSRNALLDSITFAGNGEPTVHPQFAQIVDHAVDLRNQYFPQSKVSVLTNAAKAHLPAIRSALLKTDQPIMKLDAGSQKTFEKINNTRIAVSLRQIVETLESFGNDCIVQTLFVKGIHNGQFIDNSTDEEVGLWLGHIARIKPRLVMIYPIARNTPAEHLQVVPFEVLNHIAEKVFKLGIEAEVF